MPPNPLTKLLLACLLGFFFGLLLGSFSSFLMYYCLPDEWLANGFRDRGVRHSRWMTGRECRKQGFIESYDAATNAIEVCVCFANWMTVPGAAHKVCSRTEYGGYGERGWG